MGELACIPYNQHDPERSIWWLFPKVPKGRANWPAYHLGKYFVDKRSGRLRLGVHIEKGLGLELAALHGAANRKHYALTPQWRWHSFLNDLRTDRLARALKLLAARAPVELEVDAGPTPFEAGAPRSASTSFSFRYVPGGTSDLDCFEASPREKMLSGLEAVRSLQALADRLTHATQEPWYWVNVIVYVPVLVGPSPGLDVHSEWTPIRFWNDAFLPLRNWVG
ncbi:hypothetical protein [Myxococcus sp. NMCA1]|uniref:hypothetical protein n=1 Tax=Myxococcus sp. NMCA1 TaxID=2996785 RepID=UPI00228591C6|nr:hypothetical protein [Myxococcus sp. NMCA1]WAM30048.1 hypothetical protein OZ403_18725 [Myxococcus sp. NMCA1]